MRKILFIFLIPFVIYGQTGNITFDFDSLGTTSDSVQLKSNHWLSGLFVSDTLDVDTFYVQVHIENDTTTAGADNWYYVYEDGARFIGIGDETDACFIPLEPKSFYFIDEGTSPRKFWIRLEISSTDATNDSFSIKGVTLEYP